MRWGGLGCVCVLWVGCGGCNGVDALHLAAVHLDSGDQVTIAAIRGGDELVVAKDKSEFLVRLLGVQAFDPVLTDAYVQAQSQRATQFLEPWAGKRVHVYFDATRLDPSGRFWAYVQGAPEELNLQMVREGIAPVYTEYAFGHERAYVAAERQARSEGKGIWADAKTIAVVSGLRRLWRQSRQNHHAPMVADPLLP